MNYLETGLPHTEYFPKKSDFNPPRSIPLCGLGRKYLGLEPVSKRDLKVFVNRLCQPKKVPEPDDASKLVREVNAMTSHTGRFVGRKRMTGFQIGKMVDRLYNRRSTKNYAFVDTTVGPNDIHGMTDRHDSDSEQESDSKVEKERQNSILRRQSSAFFDRSDDQSLNRRNEDMPDAIRKQTSVTFRLDAINAAVEKDSPSEANEVSKIRFDTDSRPASSLSKDNTPVGRQSPRSPVADDSKSTRRNDPLKLDMYMSHKMARQPSIRCVDIETLQQRPKSEVRRAESFTTTTSSTKRAQKSESSSGVHPSIPRSAKSDGGRSPRQKVVDDQRRAKSARLPCDDQLIDKVANHNKSRKVRCK